MPHLALRRFLRAHRGLEYETFRNNELLQLFIDSFPLLMRDAARCIVENRRLDNSLANFGLTIPTNWISDVYLLCGRLENIAQRIAATYSEPDVPYLTTIKDKFGGLRVYFVAAGPLDQTVYSEQIVRFEQEIESTESKFQSGRGHE